MRVMVLVKATEESEKGFKLTPEMKALMEAMGKFQRRAGQGRHYEARRLRWPHAIFAG